MKLVPPLRLVQPSVYATAIDQDRYLRAPHMYLAVSTDAATPEVVRRIPQLVKISSHDSIDRLIRQALPGVGLTHVPNPPSAIPVKRSHQYFLVNQSGPDWEAVLRARNLSAYVTAELPDPRMELVLILPEE